MVIFPSADGQEEAGVHQEQAFPQEGQETYQEILIEVHHQQRHIVDGREEKS